MTKSIIEKRKEFKQAQIEFTNFGVQSIKNWTKQELKNYKSKPVIIPIGDYGFLIGPYKVIGKSKDCWEVSNGDKKIADFSKKATAVLFGLFNINRQYSRATELLELDSKLGRVLTDIKIYENLLNNPRFKQDNLKYSIMLNRYIDAKMHRRSYENILKKTINSAKYINFGNHVL